MAGGVYREAAVGQDKTTNADVRLRDDDLTKTLRVPIRALALAKPFQGQSAIAAPGELRFFRPKSGAPTYEICDSNDGNALE
jgi:hypothetical protein